MTGGVLGRAALSLTAVSATALAVLTTGVQAAAPVTVAPSAAAVADIPAAYLRAYTGAATRCPGLSWTLLAGVGKVETDHGRAARLVSPTGAQGPMQVEPATWSAFAVDADGDGRADPFDVTDATATAAAYLCALGVGSDPHAALVAYNCGSTSAGCQVAAGGYAALVLAWAARYANPVPGSAARPVGPVAALAVRAALAQLGTPYVWGGASPAGFDCSGLVQWAYARAGLALPRVAQDQLDAGPAVSAADLAAGDLVFFGADPAHVTHVGLYLGDGRMVDAPHTGATVRVEPVQGFTPPLVAATRPVGGQRW